MPIKDIDEFASTGTKTEPSASEKARGWVGGEQVAGDQHNWWMNQVTDKLNEIISEGVDMLYPDGDGAKDAIASQLWASEGTPWAMFDDTSNKVDAGDIAICDLEVYYPSPYTPNQDPYLMILERATDANVIHVYNARTGASVDTSGTLGGLDTTASKAYDAVDFCTDGTYVYVLFWEGGSGADLGYVQKYDIATWTAQWNSGTAGTSTTMTNSTYPVNSQIIIASSTHLAVSLDGSDPTAEGFFHTHLISTGVHATGNGDYAAGPGDEHRGALCSDGTNLYSAFFDNSTSKDVFYSAQVSSLGSGSATASDFPHAGTTAVDGVARMLCPAPGVIAMFWDTETVEYRAVTFGTEDNLLADTVLIPNNIAQITAAGGSPRGDDTRYQPLYGYDACFDGTNFWFLGGISSGGKIFRAVYKLPAASLIASGSLRNYTTLYQVAEPFIVNGQEDGGLVSGDASRMIFDGRDIWVAPEPDSGQTLSGEVYRLPRANNR